MDVLRLTPVPTDDEIEEDDGEVIVVESSHFFRMSDLRSRWASVGRSRRAGMLCGACTFTSLFLFLVFYFAIAPVIIAQYSDSADFTFLNVTMTEVNSCFRC